MANVERFNAYGVIGLRDEIKGYTVKDELSSFPIPHIFTTTLKEAKEKAKKLNRERGWDLSLKDKLAGYNEEEVKKVKESLLKKKLREAL